jgi:hypothetical protein
MKSGHERVLEEIKQAKLVEEAAKAATAKKVEEEERG